MASQFSGPSSFGPPPQDPYYNPHGPAPQSRFPWFGCLIGCLIMAVLSCVICCGVGAYLFQKWPNFAGLGLNTTINESPMSPSDKETATAQVDRVVQEYQDGNLEMMQFFTAIQEIANSPLVPLAYVLGVEDKFVKASSLSPEEKAEFPRTLQRLARAVSEKKLNADDIQPIYFSITRKQNEQRTYRERLTNDQLRDLLKQCQKLVDDLKIPDEPFEIDLGAEHRKLVDELLKPKKAD